MEKQKLTSKMQGSNMESMKLPGEAEKQTPQSSVSNGGEKPLKTLLEAREKRDLPHKTNSESSCESYLKPTNCEEPSTSGLGCASESSISGCSSISTIGSARLTESQTSGYTTESSYQTATADIGSYANPRRSSNYLREIHVGVERSATGRQIQEIRSDLRSLLCNEVALINEVSGGRQHAIYLIAYSFM